MGKEVRLERTVSKVSSDYGRGEKCVDRRGGGGIQEN